MADQTVKKGTDSGVIELKEPAPPAPLNQSDIATPQPNIVGQVLRAMGRVTARYEGPDVTEGLGVLTNNQNILDRTASTICSGLSKIQAFALDQRPVNAAYSEERGASLEIGAKNWFEPLQTVALARIQAGLQKKGINPLEAASVAEATMHGIGIVPPLTAQAQETLLQVADDVSARIAKALESRGIDANNAAVPTTVARQGLVFDRKLEGMTLTTAA